MVSETALKAKKRKVDHVSHTHSHLPGDSQKANNNVYSFTKMHT